MRQKGLRVHSADLDGGARMIVRSVHEYDLFGPKALGLLSKGPLVILSPKVSIYLRRMIGPMWAHKRG